MRARFTPQQRKRRGLAPGLIQRVLVTPLVVLLISASVHPAPAAAERDGPGEGLTVENPGALLHLQTPDFRAPEPSLFPLGVPAAWTPGALFQTAAAAPFPWWNAGWRLTASTPTESSAVLLDGWGPTQSAQRKTNYYPLATPASVPTTVGYDGRVIQTIELRGWIVNKPRGTENESACNAESGMPFRPRNDWDTGFNLRVDPAWLVALGLAPRQIFRAGAVAVMSTRTPESSPADIATADLPLADLQYRRAGVPYVHVELSPWKYGPAPKSWTRWDLCPSPPHPFPGFPNNIQWPFVPVRPATWQRPLRKGDYVRVVGSLVLDAGHAVSALQCIVPSLGGKQCYDPDARVLAALTTGGDEGDPARHTEFHSPDLVEQMPSPGPPSETVFGIYKGQPLAPGSEPPMDIPAPPARPSWATGIDYELERLWGTAPDPHVVKGVSGIHVEPFPRLATYAGIFRVFWTGPKPAPLTITADPSLGSPPRLYLGESVALQVSPAVPVRWSTNVDRDAAASTGYVDADTGLFHAATTAASIAASEVDGPSLLDAYPRVVTVGARATDGSGRVAYAPVIVEGSRRPVSKRLAVSVSPWPIPTDRPVDVSIAASDASTHASVTADVTVDGRPVGRTPTTFHYSFAPSEDYAVITIVVSAQGYLSTEISVRAGPHCNPRFC
jgi:hypothetical protein